MASFFDKFKKKAEEVSKGVYHQVRMDDGGRTYDTNARGVKPGTPNPYAGNRDNQPGFQLTNNSLTRGVSRGVDQVNPVDGNRTWQQRQPTNWLSSVDQFKKGTNNVALGTGLRGVRSATGFAQGVTGLYDLASPGTGTNRLSKQLHNFALQTDKTAANEGVNTGYTASALPIELLGFKGTGATLKGAAKGANKIPSVTKATLPVTKAVEKASTQVAPTVNKMLPATDTVGRIARKTVAGTVSPTQTLGNLGFTSKMVGENASKGRDTDPKQVAEMLRDNLLFQAGMPFAGAVAKEGFKASAPAVKKTIQVTNDNVNAQRVQARADQKRIEISDNNKAIARAQSVNDKKTARVLIDRNAALGQEYKKLQKQSDILNKNVGMSIRAVGNDGKPLPVSAQSKAPIQSSKQGEISVSSKQMPQSQAVQKNIQTYPETVAQGQPPATQRPASLVPQTEIQVGRELLGPENLVSRLQQATPSVNGTTNSVVKQSIPRQSRAASKTAPNSVYLSDGLANSVKANAPSYIPETVEGRLGNAGTRLNKEGQDEFTKTLEKRLDTEPGKISSQDVTDTQGLAAILDAKGDDLSLQKATDLYTKLSEHLTAAGQTVQAAALIAKRTPQGLRFYAQKQLEKAGIKMTPEKTKELMGLIAQVKKAKNGSEAELIARDNVQYWVAKNIPSNKADQIVNFWRSGLLTAPTTTGGALAGNTFATIQRKLWTNPVATMTDMVFALGTGKRSRALAAPGAFGEGFKRGASNVNPIKKDSQYWKTGYDPMNPNATADSMGANSRRVNYGDGRLGRATGQYVNGVYKLMGAVDQPYRYAAFDEVMSSLARSEAINKGITGEARDAFVKEFMSNPPKAALQRATDEAMDATFQNRTALADAITSLKQGLKQKGHTKSAALVDFFIPFSGVPSSVASRVVRNTPIGTANQLVKQIINVRKGEAFDQRIMAQAIGEGTVGLPIVAAGYTLAQNDMFNGGYPSDPKERQKWTDENRQENSVKIGGRWYSLNYIQPFGTLLSVGAGISQAEGEDGDNPALSDYLKKATQSGVQSFAGQSYLEGITAPLEAINNPEQEAGRYIAGAASGIVPNFVRSAARASDTVQRDATGLGDGIKGAIPGLRQTLPAKIGSDGNPLPNKDNFLNMYVNPLKPSKEREDNPVVKETSRLLSAENGVSAAPVKKLTYGKDIVNLDKQEQEEYNKQLGTLRNKNWNALINSSEYKSLSDADKKKALENASQKASAFVRYEYAKSKGLDVSTKEVDKPIYDVNDVTSSTSTSIKLPEGMNGYDIETLKKFAGKSADEKNKIIRSEKDAEYKLELAEYERDTKLNKLSDTQKIVREGKLAKLKVGKDYDKNIRELYELAKAKTFDFVSKDKDGAKLAEQLLKYDEQLFNSGVTKFMKYKNGLAPAAKGGTGRKGTGKGRKERMANFSTIVLNKSPNLRVANVAPVKKPTIRKRAMKKQ